uniref:Uncharacterized protein n=2 Tax=Stomoxys calcitrans TaxID=35570 RepID=A0A1I8Q3V3_STOCA
METNYPMLLLLILLSFAKFGVQAAPMRGETTFNNEIMNDVLLDLDGESPKLWDLKRKYTYNLGDEKPTEILWKKDVFEKDMDDAGLFNDFSVLIRSSAGSTSTSTTTTTPKPTKAGFWQRIKALICNDFDYSKAAEQSGSLLEPIVEVIDDVERSETWKTVSKYASKTKDVVAENVDELGDKLIIWKDDLKDMMKKINF